MRPMSAGVFLWSRATCRHGDRRVDRSAHRDGPAGAPPTVWICCAPDPADRRPDERCVKRGGALPYRSWRIGRSRPSPGSSASIAAANVPSKMRQLAASRRRCRGGSVTCRATSASASAVRRELRREAFEIRGQGPMSIPSPVSVPGACKLRRHEKSPPVSIPLRAARAGRNLMRLMVHRPQTSVRMTPVGATRRNCDGGGPRGVVQPLPACRAEWLMQLLRS